MRLSYSVIKRFFDLVLSFLLLVVLIPLFVIVSILVFLDLGLPIFFVQYRPGLDCKLIPLFKFRTMRISSSNIVSTHDDSVRITRLGSILRRTSLDEIPSFLNIFLGHMSFVGPRPLLEQYLPLYSSRQIKRHDVPPGLTGLAQINGRNSITWTQKFEYDLLYVQNKSFFLDMLILFRSIAVVFMARNVTSPGSSTSVPFEGF